MTYHPSFDPHRRFFAHAHGCERMIGIRGFAITRGVVNAAVYQLISNLGKPLLFSYKGHVDTTYNPCEQMKSALATEVYFGYKKSNPTPAN